MASHWSLQSDASYLGSHYPVPTSVCWALPSLLPSALSRRPFLPFFLPSPHWGTPLKGNLLTARTQGGRHLWDWPACTSTPAPRRYSSLLGALYTLHHKTGYLRKAPWMLFVLLEARGMCSEYLAKELKQTDWQSICCCSVTKSSLTLCDPMDCSTPGFPIHHQLTELAQPHVHQVGESIQPSHPLSSHSPPAFNLSQHRGLF